MQNDLSHAEIKVNPSELIDPSIEAVGGQPQVGPAWLKPNQKAELLALAQSKAYTPRAYTDMVGGFAKENGRQWTPEIAAQQMKNLPTRFDQAPQGISYMSPTDQLNKPMEAAPPREEAPGFFDNPLGYLSGSSRTEFPNLKELNVADIGGLQGVGYQAATSLAFDDQGKQGILSTVLGDQKPTFTTDKFGNSLVTFGDGENKGKSFYINKPGFSGQDLSTLGTNIALTALPGGLAARGAATTGMGALRVGGAAALGSMAGESVRQIAGNTLGDTTRANNLLPGVDLMDLTTAGVTEGIPAGATFKATNFARPAGAPANIDQIITENAALFDRTGVPALRGQVAGTGSELERTRVLQSLPETGAGMADAFKAQNAAVSDATTGMVNDIAAPSGILAEAQAVNAAKNAITGAKSTRSAAGGPLFEAALNTGAKIDTTTLAKELKAVAGSKGAVAGTPFGDKIAKVENIIKAGDDWQLDPRQVQAVKIDISDARKAALREGRDGLANQLADVEDKIVLFLDDAAPGYKQANEAWRQLSVPVKELQDSAVGTLANLDQFGLQQFSRRLFSGQTSAQERAFVKANLDKADPEAYRRMVQSDMGRRLDEISDIGTDTGIENTPRLINAALFRNEAQRKMWKEALPDMADRLDDLHYVMNLATTGRNAGSTTATKNRLVEGLTSMFERGGSGLRTTLLNWTVGLPITATEKGLGIVGTARTQKIRAGALAEQVSPDVSKMLGEYAEKAGKSNPRLSAILQSVRQFAMSDPVGSDQASQSLPDEMQSIPVLTGAQNIASPDELTTSKPLLME